MHTSVAKWGNSLGVRIPAPIAKEAGLSEGRELEIFNTEEGLLLRPVAPKRPKYVLSQLLDGVSPENMHEPVEWGEPQGDEVW
jgi:antitoxin MazE